MRRIGMAVCALAILCQMLVLPVMAAPSVASAGQGTLMPDGSIQNLIGYKDYVAQNPGDAATESVVIPGTDGKESFPAPEIPEADEPAADAPEADTPEADAPEADAPEADAPEADAPAADEPVTVDEPVADKPAEETVTATENSLIFNTLNAQATWEGITVPKTGWYKLGFTYSGVEGKGSSSDMELSLLINGKAPFAEAMNFVLPRIWVDDGEIRVSNMNEFAPEQKEVFDPQKKPLRDVNGFVNEDLCVYLTAGENYEFTLISTGEPIAIYSIHLDPPTTVLSYKDQIKAWEAAGIKEYTGKEFVVEAELAKRKSDRTVVGLSDNSNPAVKPSDAYHQKVNYIGGSNWSMTDEEIVWTVKAPAAGLYKVGFHYRQNYLVNATCYRSLKVNGEHQYAEMATIGFDYKNNWKFMESFANGDAILVYLNEGENEVSLTVTLGAMNEFSAQMEDLTYKLGEMYRDIIAIIGETPDKNTDYELFTRIPTLAKEMEALRDQIAKMIDSRRVGKDIDDNAAMLQKMDVVLEKMLKKQYEAQNYKGNFYDCYSSLTAQLQDMKTMALDLDCMVFASPDTAKCERNSATFWQKMWFGIQRFIASFLLDYNTSNGKGGDVDLTLWVNWSRDQTMVLNSLINSSFAEQHASN